MSLSKGLKTVQSAGQSTPTHYKKAKTKTVNHPRLVEYFQIGCFMLEFLVSS